MKNEDRSGLMMIVKRTPTAVLMSVLITATFVLGACGGDNGNADNGNAANGAGTAATATLVAQVTTAPAATATTESAALTETIQAAETTGITQGADTGVADIAVITGTQLITGTKISTNTTVSTDTSVIEQQLITTVITNTDVVSNVVNSNNSSTNTQTQVITDAAKLTPEGSTGQAVANVAVTPLAPTATPTIVVAATKVVTDTQVVTRSIEVTAVATPQPGQGQTPATAVPAAAASAAGTTFAGIVDAQGKTILASTLLDSKFLTSDGQVSGEVQDAVVDVQTGQLLYILLEYGGVLDVGDRDLPAPPSAFSLKSDGELLLNIPPEHLQQFPDVGNDWPQAGQANWDNDVRAYWSKEGFPASSQPATSGNRIRRISTLIGGATSKVDQGAGKVEDMAISLDQGRVAYVLVSFDNAAAGGDWYAIPISAFDPENTDKGLAFRSNFDATMLQNAPRFNRDATGQDRFLPGDYDKDWQSFWSKLVNP